MSAALAVQKAMYDTLVVNNALTSSLGGAHIYDDVPDKQKPPYAVFGSIESEDWSTGTEGGEEHLIELLCWSDKRGRKQVAQISTEISDALASLQFTSTTHHLINFTHEFSLIKRDKDSGYFLSRMRFRAVTEPVVA